MQKCSGLTAQNDAVALGKLPKGQNATLTLITDHSNPANAEIGVDVTADDANWIPVALLDKASTSGTLLIKLTGVDKIGQVELGGCTDVNLRARRIDSNGTAAIAYVGISSPSI